ncbi:MAG: hypothetical protein K0S70_189 [Microbacterium sp.]|jgi:hypothetical protein|nr:hypothetical protein [Microbacterium sp.]
MSIHEQARAEAEKRRPETGDLTEYQHTRNEGWRDGFEDGYVAGHEAATRTRVVTTVTELDALPVGVVVLTEVGRVWQKIGTAWNVAGGKRARQAEYVRLPARVLYEPQETP